MFAAVSQLKAKIRRHNPWERERLARSSLIFAGLFRTQGKDPQALSLGAQAPRSLFIDVHQS
jgi:hypothetical protein